MVQEGVRPITIKRKIPETTINRLPTYLWVLNDLQEEEEEIISSAQMSIRTGFSSEQIRKDLAYFGAFGTRGLGYNVHLLEEQIRSILGLDRLVPIALVGVGNLGQALTHYSRTHHRHLKIMYVFDVDEHLVGRDLAGIRIRHIREMEAVITQNYVRLAILAVPREVAQSVLNTLVRSGVRAVLNFAPGHLQAPEHVVLRTVDLTSELQSLAYFARDGFNSDE